MLLEKLNAFNHFLIKREKTDVLKVSLLRVFKVKFTINLFIRWRSISMRAGTAFFQFDWSKASLSMDLPVFVYSQTKTSFKFLFKTEKIQGSFYVVTDLLLQIIQREPYRALILSRLKSVMVY